MQLRRWIPKDSEGRSGEPVAEFRICRGTNNQTERNNWSVRWIHGHRSDDRSAQHSSASLVTISRRGSLKVVSSLAVDSRRSVSDIIQRIQCCFRVPKSCARMRRETRAVLRAGGRMRMVGAGANCVRWSSLSFQSWSVFAWMHSTCCASLRHALSHCRPLTAQVHQRCHRWGQDGTRRWRGRPVCAASSRGESCRRLVAMVHGQPGCPLPSFELDRSESAVACNGGGWVKREGGSAAREEQCTITGKRVVSKGRWSTASQSAPFPRAVSLRRALALGAAPSVFRLVLGHLCSFWPETSRIVISVMPYLRGNARWNHRWGSGWPRWAVGRGCSDRWAGGATVGVVTCDSSKEQCKQSG